MSEDIIAKIKEAGLCGRSGSNFPTWLKWQAVKQAKADRKYIICNASEGEPGVFKDKFILEKYPEEMVEGIKIALETLGAASAYIYINKDYYEEFKAKLTGLISDLPIELFRKPPGYLKGEETVSLNVIEGKRPEPRMRPPYPTEVGLWGKPTLINNVETFWAVSKIAKGEYKNNRFYCVSGDTPNPGVYELPETYTIEQILQETDNYPSAISSGLNCSGQANYFYQVGGGASGEILLPNELDRPVKGIGSIIVFNKEKTDPWGLMKKWAQFFLKENCDRCAPCREGVYRIAEILQKTPQEIKNEENQKVINDIFFVLEKTSLCPLGRSIIPSFKTAIEKLL